MESEKPWSQRFKKGYKDDKIGKWIGGELYFHKSAIPKLSKQTQDIIINAINNLPKNAKWNTVKYNPKSNRVVFQFSNDFDSTHEPKLVHNYAPSSNGEYQMNTNGSNTLWHHKWQWVDDDYNGFDTSKEMARSDKWKKLITQHEDEIKTALEKYRGKKINNINGAIGSIDNWNNVVLPILNKYGLQENMKRKIIRLTEGDLHKLIATTVKNILREEAFFDTPQEFDSADTSINKGKLPALHSMMSKKLIIKPNTTNFDLGGGKFDNAVELWASNGARNVVFDPYNRNFDQNFKAFDEARTVGFDSVTCSNVLNVIKEREYRLNCILQAAQVLKPNGIAYFSFYEGDKSGIGRKTSKSAWQNNLKAQGYMDEISVYFGNVKKQGNMIIATNPKESIFDEESYWMLDREDPSKNRTFKKEKK